ncbi:MFS transporter [Gracilibacillus sp. HCP3S3_G5_1]|uniref:MFS transporter n=1 Tax=unclassified Gracilibacillus TaxID=2625209 RepID=UPI003F88604A
MNILKSKNPYTVYIYTHFLSAFLFTFVFTVSLVYHVQIVGLNPLQLVLVGTVLELTVFLFEIPTGIVADIKSRKLSITIGYILIGLGFLLEGIFPFFLTVLLSQILWGIGYTFTSGAGQAWIVDEIGEERASLALIKGARASNLGKVIAIPISMIVGYMMVNLPIILGGIGMIALSLLLFLFMKEDNFKPIEKDERETSLIQMKNSLNNMMHYFRASLILRILLLIALIFGLYSEGFDRLWMPHLIDKGDLAILSDSHLVLFMGTIQFIVVLISFVVLHYISKSSIHNQKRNMYISLFIGTALIIGALFGFAFSTFIIGLLVWYIIIQIGRESINPLFDIWLNNLIEDSNMRATFFSVKGQVDSIGQISGGPAIGLIATKYTIKVALIVSTVLLSPVLLLFYIALKKDRA